ncbi:non-homologous end joining protein Ku [Kaistia sp. 32K]|uniref:non-homologous end joining protein Ku n=1 Tax=Kaistia sp. 32K TaxID=2795690 RepID=UPI0019166A8C|nr:Ku protein [Kaistia sp. 32K]BCP51559.1 non-homologous end joining protein Ku [Kaistia sp. 32K]
MAPRAIWKGYLKVAEILCPVALYTAASTSDRIAFHTINRNTGHRIRRQFVDQDTGKPVETDDQVKGYEIGSGEYVQLDADEIASAQPESDKTLAVETFLPVDAVDDVYFDRPYYLAPADKPAQEAYALIRDGMQASGAVAIARAVLFRRMRSVLIRAEENGMVATTLSFDYAVRPAREVFDDIPKLKLEGEMLKLAEHIISTKRGSFDPAAFHDRYEEALGELVKAKLEGKTFTPPAPQKTAKVVDLMAALRESAGVAQQKSTAAAKKPPAARRKTTATTKPAKPAAPRRKAS